MTKALQRVKKFRDSNILGFNVNDSNGITILFEDLKEIIRHFEVTNPQLVDEYGTKINSLSFMIGQDPPNGQSQATITYSVEVFPSGWKYMPEGTDTRGLFIKNNRRGHFEPDTILDNNGDGPGGGGIARTPPPSVP